MEIFSIPSTVIGINGPISENFLQSVETILPYESAFFDKSSNLSKSSGNRLSLENRHEVLDHPFAIRDNLVGGLDMFEYELKSLCDGQPTILCLHSNDILLHSSQENIDRFKDICKQYVGKIQVVLAIGLPTEVLNDPETYKEKGIEYLVSHVHYGSRQGLLFGLMGPIENDGVIEIYREAHARTGAPVLISSLHVQLPLIKELSFNFSKAFFIVESVEAAKEIIHSFTNQINIIVPLHALVRRFQSLDTLLQLKSDCVRIFATPGCQYKMDFKKFGGSGLTLGRSHIVCRDKSSDLVSCLSFPWNPPKLDGKQDEDYGKWVCDICGLVAKLSENENYTKHGFTYCSIACLAEHRKRGFAPLAG